MIVNLLCLLCVFQYRVDSLQYVEVFRDDFTIPWQIDQSKWNIITTPSTVNDELQYYLFDDVWQEHGYLFLRSQRRQFNGRQYTSGRVDTKSKFEFLYGEVEWRVKLPKGKGIWPALWLLQFQCPAASPCVTWPPEIDVIEARGDIENKVTFANHFGRYPSNSYVTSEFYGPNFTDDFHTFKVLWDPNQIVWYVDGVERFRVNDKNIIPHEKMYLIMNVAVGLHITLLKLKKNFVVKILFSPKVGGWYGGDPDWTTPFPTHMIIDYVTVHRWQ